MAGVESPLVRECAVASRASDQGHRPGGTARGSGGQGEFRTRHLVRATPLSRTKPCGRCASCCLPAISIFAHRTDLIAAFALQIDGAAATSRRMRPTNRPSPRIRLRVLRGEAGDEFTGTARFEVRRRLGAGGFRHGLTSATTGASSRSSPLRSCVARNSSIGSSGSCGALVDVRHPENPGRTVRAVL